MYVKCLSKPFIYLLVLHLPQVLAVKNYQVYKLLKIDKIQLEDGILSKVMKSALGKMNSVDREAESVHLTRRYLKKQGFLEKLHLKMLNDISKYGWDDDPDPMWRNKKSNENDIVERNNKKRKIIYY